MEDKVCYVCALDFEATCEKEKLIKNQEIIEFPSVLYKVTNMNNENTEYEMLGEFREFIKPIHNPVLTDFCKELTAITQEEVDNGIDFKQALRMHIEWLMDKNVDMENLIFVTCGQWDLKTALPNNLKLFNLQRACKYYKKIINIKDEYKKFYKFKTSNLVEMLTKINEEFDGRLHSGLADTKAVGKLLTRMMNDGHKNFEIINLY